MTREELMRLEPGQRIEVSMVADNTPVRGPLLLATVMPSCTDNNPWSFYRILVLFDGDATGQWHYVTGRDVVRVVEEAAHA